jgi:hypothetical protein
MADEGPVLREVIGAHLDVVVTDPWDVVTEIGDRPRAAVVDSFEEAGGRVVRIIANLEQPLVYRDQGYDRSEITPRHRDAPSALAMMGGARLPSNMEALASTPNDIRPLALLGEVGFSKP